MAIATATFTESAFPNGTDLTGQRRAVIYGTLAITASPATYAAGGLALSFTGISDINFSKPYPVRVELASRRGSGYIYFWTIGDNWTLLYKSATVAAGQFLTDSNGNLQKVTTGGTTGSTEPTWNTVVGGTTTDNAAVWTNQGISSGTIQIFGTGSSAGALGEIATGVATAIPAGVSGDLISCRLEFIKG